MTASAPLRLCASAFLAFTLAARAAIDPITRNPLRNPAIERAAARNTAAGVFAGATATNRMAPASVRVLSRSVLAGQLVSRMTDGSTVVAPLQRATTARVPEALVRLRIDRALARIAAAVADDASAKDSGKRADRLEQLAVKLEKEQAAPKPVAPPGKGKAGGGALLGGVAAACGAAAYGYRRWAVRA
jgi:hypothetical protein